VTVDLQNIYNFRFYGPIYMGSTARKVNVIYDTGSDVNTFTLYFSGWLLSLQDAGLALEATTILILPQATNKLQTELVIISMDLLVS